MGGIRPSASAGTPPLDDVQAAVYPVIGEPPSNGGENDTTTLAFPALTMGLAGASGTALSTTGADATEGRPAPFMFVARTVHVYVCPCDRPPRMIGDVAPPLLPGTPPSEDVQSTV